MDDRVNNIYYKIKYYQKLYESLSPSELKQMEDDVYNNIPDDKRIKYELNSFNDFNVSRLDSIYYAQLLKNIRELADKHDENNIIEIKKQITILQTLLNENIGFYKALVEIDRDYVIKSLRREK